MNPKSNIVCVGDIMVECILRLPSLPPANATLVLDSVSQELGGAAFNICWYLSQFGLRPRLIGPVGQRNNALVAEAFSSAKLDDSGLVSIEGDTDLLIAILTDRYHYSIYLRARVPDDIGLEMLSRCGSAKCLVLAGSRHASIRRTFLALADTFSGEFLAFNPSYAIYEYDKEELAKLLKQAHVATLNEQEAERACKALDVSDCERLSKYVPGSLIVTLGEKGVRVYHQSRVLEMGSLTGSQCTAVGAGDAFFAGFLFETIRGCSVVEATRFASGLAAYVVEASQVRAQVSEDRIRQGLTNYQD